MTNINFAIVGCGRIAQRHAEHIENTDQCKLVACCDIVPERASSLAQKYKILSPSAHQMVYTLNIVYLVFKRGNMYFAKNQWPYLHMIVVK